MSELDTKIEEVNKKLAELSEKVSINPVEQKIPAQIQKALEQQSDTLTNLSRSVSSFRSTFSEQLLRLEKMKKELIEENQKCMKDNNELLFENVERVSTTCFNLQAQVIQINEHLAHNLLWKNSSRSLLTNNDKKVQKSKEEDKLSKTLGTPFSICDQTMQHSRTKIVKHILKEKFLQQCKEHKFSTSYAFDGFKLTK